MRPAPFFLSACMILATAAPALAQSRQELDQRLGAVEQRLPATEDAVRRTLDQLGSLEAQIRTLTGQVEELQFRNRQLETRLQALQEDMLSAYSGGYGGFAADEGGMGDMAGFAPAQPGQGAPSAPGGPVRLGPNGTGAGGDDFAIVDQNDPFAAQRRAATRPLGGGAAPAGGQPAPGEATALTQDYAQTGDNPDLLFQRGRTRMFEGDFSAALDAFAEFVEVAPDDPRAGEAWFWAGRIYRTQSRPVEAADALVRSLQFDERSPMAPEAMVQLGASLAEMGQRDQACQTLRAAVQRYPDMDSTVRAAATREQRNAGC